MARLPTEFDLATRRAPANSQAVRAPVIDYSPEAQGAAAIGRGVQSIGKAGLDVAAEIKRADDEVNDYETRKRLLDFEFENERALEEAKRNMPAGGVGYTDAVRKSFMKRAKAFVGENDKNIPEALRQQVGLLLKKQETALLGQAQNHEWQARDAAEIEGLEQTLGAVRSRVEADPNKRDELLRETERLIELSRLSPDTKARTKKKMAVELDKSAAIARLMKAETVDDYEALKRDLAPDTADAMPNVTVSGGDGKLATVTSQSGAKFSVAGAHADRFAGLIRDLEAAGVEVKATQSGGYANRPIAGTNTPSRHSFGEAIDINWDENSRGAPGSLSKQLTDEQIKALAKKHGLVWGGTWKNRDDMHFEVDRSAEPPRPVSQRGMTTVAGMSKPEGYAGPFSNLTLSQRKELWNQAETKRKAAVAEVGKQLTELEGVVAKGKLFPEPQMQALDAAIKATGDQTLAARWQSAVATQEFTASLSVMRPEQARAEVDAIKASLGDRATPEQQKTLELAEQAAENVEKGVNDNPIAWANGRIQVDGETIRFEQFSPDDAEGWSRHFEKAQKVAAYYGREINPLSKGQQTALANAMKAGGDEMLSMIGAMVKGGGRAALPAFQSLAREAPEAATVGWMVANGASPDAINDAAKGMALRRKPDFKSIAPAVDWARGQATALVGTAMAEMPASLDAVIQTANAIYDQRALAAGVASKKDAPFNSEIWNKAFLDALGVTTDRNGVQYGGMAYQEEPGMLWGTRETDPVLIPPYLRNDALPEVMSMLAPKHLADNWPHNERGEPMRIAEVRTARLMTVGDGEYHMFFEDGDERRFLLDKNGQKAVLNLNQIAPSLKRSRPDLFRP